MKKMRSILAMLLCVVMVVGLVPTSVFAAETVIDAAIFCSDVHGSTSDLSSVMAGVKTSGVTYSSIGFVGDTCLTVANTESTVSSGLGYTPTVMFSYASSHDKENSSDISTNWDYSGEVEGVSNNYLVYTIRETDMQNDTTAEDDFTTWYNGLTDAEKALPIFIMSHRPLHHRRKDNANATDWYNAISAAAKSSDIVVFWAHNHTSESDVDTAAYYVAKNGTESFTLGTTSSSGGDTVVPNFTYMNAGYINANNQNPARLGIATTVQITADSLIFQDYNSSGAYTGTYAHNVTVEREFAASEPALTGLSVSAGTKTYYVGDELELTVTAYYDNDTTNGTVVTDYTADAVDMSTSGEKTVTVSYGGLTASTTVTVNELYINSIAVTTKPTKTTYTTGEELNLDGMVVTATYNNGSTAVITNWYQYGAVDMTTAGEKTVTIAYSNNGTIFKATFTITVEQGVAEDVTLENIEITTPPTKTEYLLNEELNLDGMVVVANFSDGSAVELQYKPFSTSTVYGGYELYNFSMYVEKAHELTVAYTYGDVTCYDSTTINVWNEDFTDNTNNTGVKVHVTGDYGVTDIKVAESENTNVETAIADVIVGDNYVAYDIELVFDEGYTETTATKTVTLPIPSGVSNPVVYYVPESGAAEPMGLIEKTATTVTFETDHFSTYVVGESTEIEVPNPETVTGSGSTTTTEEKEVYVLVSAPTAGNQYIIVNRNTAGSGYALKENTTTGSSITVNAAGNGVSAPYIETTDETIMWNTASGMTFQSENGSYYLRYDGGLAFSTRSSTNWTVGANSAYTYNSSRYRYIYNSNGTWTTSSSRNTSSSYNVYFYEKQTVNVETTTTVSGTYAINGTPEELRQVVEAGDTVTLGATLTFTPDSGTATTTDVSTAAAYAIVTVDAYGNTVDGDPNDIISKIENGVVTFTGNYGTALVKVSYTTDFGVVTDYITIEAKAPYYTIELHEADLTKVTITEFTEGVTYYTFNETTNTYDVATSYVEGTTYYTTPVVQGEEITETIALKGIQAGDTYAVWAVVKEHTSADPDGVDMGALGNALTWTVSDTTIATIDTTTGVITFTGTNYGTFNVTVAYKGADGKVITDTITISVTDSLYVVPGDGTNDFPEYPNEGAVRFDKTATAVGNYSETGIAKVELSMTGVPYTTGSELDVVVMLDMSTSMDDTRIAATVAATKVFIESIVKNEDGTYNGNRVYVGYFNGDTVYTITGTDNIGGELASVDNDTEYNALIAAIEDEYDGALTASGTNYDVSLEECYNVLTAAKSTNLPPEAETAADYSRQQFVVFMSDGGPTDYATSASNVVSESTVVNWFSVSDSDSANWTNTMVEEYWSGLMKDDGVTIYSVGMLLNEAPENNGPQDYRGYTDDQSYYITSTLMIGIASGADYFFNCESSTDTTDMENIFSNIATKIHEAATNVVVEDKIGSNYTVNFSIPGYGTDNEVSADALDGTTEFYIQAVEYQLDANKERTGDPTILENFTFNSNGTLKSHTVNGTACSSCSHVTTTNGVITKIDGTYFDYEVKADGEYLTWNSEKITTTELALQYFAYLDNSTGVDLKDQIAAGTYYTNEYATLTYTNYNGNQVQQEFPIPQMTWNGAQVSYVFYLVNAAGQPVNKAGRVVPFAEAVYITDVYTHHVLWNDLEQSAGLEAKYLAEELVPDIYALYDDDAGYNIHVYEDEAKVNLNNHFVIKGDVTDDYNTTWTNAKTTYVFNAKSDAIKYNTAGAYIAYDEDKVATTYLCKGDGTTNASFDVAADVTKDNFASGTYYTLDAEGKYVYAPNYTEGVTYYKITSASYTAVEGETQALASSMESTTGGTIIDGYVYYVDEYGKVYTIVQKSNGTEVREGFDFSNTTVAFAVVWKAELTEDVVVVDYGLDVVVNVAENDALASGVVGVRADAPNAEINKGTYDAAKATSADIYIDANADADRLKIGTATVENMDAVRFSLDKTNGTQFNDPAVFYYESDVNYYDSNNELKSTSMYSSVTVIPATTVYYEDSFVTYTNSSNADETYGTWAQEGTTLNKTQATDRPGENKLNAAYDADNVYGYDAAYSTSSTYSMGSAMKVKVKSGVSGMASFVFYGTGFDVMSMTDSTTGMILVQVFNESNEKVKDYAVNTYYGYAYGLHKATYTYTCVQEATETTEAVYSWLKTGAVAVTTAGTDGEPAAEPKEGDTYVAYETGWYLAPSDNAVYQVPVIKINNLPYGKYTVKVIASYNTVSDVTGAGSYNFYLDGIRIYDPTGVVAGEDVHDTNGVVSDAYIADGEAWPEYAELRNNIITANDFNALTEGQQTSGLIFIDNTADTDYNVEYEIADYISYGPNNELYLANNQAIAFNVADAAAAKDVQLGIKLANGSSVTYEINGDSYTVTSATEMYYSILEYAQDGVVVIENVGGGILSLTNIKVTYAPAADAEATSLMWMDDASAEVALMSLRRAPVVEEEIPEVTEPEATEPEEIIPEETVPEATEPEATEPEATEPEEIIPEETAPEATEPEATEPETSIVETITNAITNVINKITNALSNLFSRWFR